MSTEPQQRYTLRHAERVHLYKDFQHVLKTGRRLVHPALFIYVVNRRDGSELRRLGLITSRKLGTAVERNRLKRRLREIFRLNKHRLAPGIDMLFQGRPPQAVGLNYRQLEAVVLSLWKKAGILLPGDREQTQDHGGRGE